MGGGSLQNPYHTSRFAPYVLFGVHRVANLRRMGSLLFRRHACNFFARVLWFLYTSLKKSLRSTPKYQTLRSHI